jgi:tRNA-splicing ligase RtcB
MRVYAEVLEPEALRQMEHACSLDFVLDGALMPDAHTGYELPIGAVVATDGVVVPSWVGYDIGCGMSALKLELRPEEFDAAEIKERIESVVPTGFDCHESDQECELPLLDLAPSERVYRRSLRQLGTLGGGNHFLEVGVGRDGFVWIVVHSGSRGIGHAVASWYMSHCDEYLSTDSADGQSYEHDLEVCLEYALQNRRLMVDRAAAVMPKATRLEFINRNHNHAELKDGRWIHRKGATHAEYGMMGVIPGNMRDGSFIVRGKGNPEWLCSSSHGAGRVYGRRAAKRELDVEEFERTMMGVCANVSKDTLDESPMAYKNIFDVMELQSESVEVVDYIRPLLNIKG